MLVFEQNCEADRSRLVTLGGVDRLEITEREAHMKARNFSRVVVVLAAAWALALPTLPSAQSYPIKPVRVVVPFAPGGGTDIQARVLFRELNEQFRQTFIVDNRPGASGLIGAEAVVNAPADGYTLLFTTATLAVNATLYKGTLKFDPVKDLAPVVWVSSTPLVLIVHPNVPVKSAQEMIELARKKPALLNSAINVPGSTSHLAAEMLKQLAGLSFTTVPYKGGGLSMMAVLSGEVDFQFAEGLLAAPQIKAGKVRALAVTTSSPSAAFPGLPTMNATLPGFVADNWFAMYFPAGTPREIVATINAAIRKALETKTVRALFEQDALNSVGSSPEELAAHLKGEIDRFAEVIRKGNITAQ
jgi:tripartite-type tricarboxylate transporter receptor subunit TctC